MVRRQPTWLLVLAGAMLGLLAGSLVASHPMSQPNLVGLPAAAEFTPAFSGAGRDAEPLVFTGNSPCVLFDTRPLAAKQGFGATTYGTALAFDNTTVGGDADCGVPADARAALINLVAIEPSGGGNLRISDTGVDASGGVVNYSKQDPNLNNSNAIIVDTLNDPVDKSVDVFVNGQPVHVRGVLLGWLSPLLDGVVHVSASGSPTDNGDAMRAALLDVVAPAEVRLGPGDFEVTDGFGLLPGIVLSGAGMGITTIRCSCSTASTSIGVDPMVAAGGGTLRDLTVDASAAGAGEPHLTAISGPIRLERVEVLAATDVGGAAAYGVFSESGTVTIIDSRVAASSVSDAAEDDADAWSVLVNGGVDLEVRDSSIEATIEASAGTGRTFGISVSSNDSHEARVVGSTILADVFGASGEQLFATALRVVGANTAIDTVDSHVISDDSFGLSASGDGILRIADSTVDISSPSISTGGQLICVNNHDPDFVGLGTSCT